MQPKVLVLEGYTLKALLARKKEHESDAFIKHHMAWYT